MISLSLPLRTVSTSNVREHWSARARRARDHRNVTGLVVRAELPRLGPEPLPCAVTLTRIAPRVLDDDNLRGALKSVRDGVADALGVTDRDPLVSWAYGQAKGPPRTFAVLIEVCAGAAAKRNPGATS